MVIEEIQSTFTWLGHQNPKPETQNIEPETWNMEPKTQNTKHRTQNPEL